jgi:CDP-diacylglycerol--serine O-phosphatidyltransferase
VSEEVVRAPRRRRRRGRRRGNNRRAIFLLPNLVTSAALLLGFASIIRSTHQDFDRAALFIILAGICDMLDGRIARATNATSKFGLEYDSLSDLVSFGLAPALLMYNWALVPVSRGWLIAALFVLCTALRLARFNVGAQEKYSVWYQGMPSTFAGGMVAATVWFVTWTGLGSPVVQPLTSLVTIGFAGLALLMVSPIPYPSLKIIQLDRGSYPTLVALVLLSVGLLLAHDWLFFVLGLVFTLSGPVSWIYRWRTGTELVPSLEPPAEQIDA